MSFGFMPAFRRSEFLAVLIPSHLSKIFFVTLYCLLRDIRRNPVCVFWFRPIAYQFHISSSFSLSFRSSSLFFGPIVFLSISFSIFLIVHSWLIKCYTLCWVGLQLVVRALCYRQRRRVGTIGAALLRSWDRVQCQLSVCPPASAAAARFHQTNAATLPTAAIATARGRLLFGSGGTRDPMVCFLASVPRRLYQVWPT